MQKRVSRTTGLCNFEGAYKVFWDEYVLEIFFVKLGVMV